MHKSANALPIPWRSPNEPYQHLDRTSSGRVKKIWLWLTVTEARPLLLALSLGFAYGSYFVLRYGGYWAEQDSQFFVFAIVRMISAGRLIYNEAYSHGFAYPLWASALSLITDLDVGILLRLYTPVIGSVFLALFGFATFRRLLASDYLALTGTLTLFLIPELVFTVSRGNHEKLTVSLLLFILLIMVRSFAELSDPKRRPHVYLGWTLSFYLSAFALISVNIIFGSGILLAVTLAGLAVRVLSWRPFIEATTRQRLMLIARRLSLMFGTAWIIAFCVMWYFYPPARLSIDLYGMAFDRVSVLGDSTQEVVETVDPYAAITTDWISPQVYTWLTAFRWLLFAGATLTWLVLMVKILTRPERQTVARMLLVGLYGAFSLELALAVLLDVLGASEGAANIQVRLFSYYALVAAPLFAIGIDHVRQLAERIFPPRLMLAVSALALSFFLATSALKATLDPLVSNNWIFYHPAEVEAMATWGHHHFRQSLWIGPEHRLWFAWVMTYPGGLPRENIRDVHQYNPLSAHAIHSSTKHALALATHTPLHPLLLENRVYDNGEAQIYHRVPRTPFQR